MLSLTQLTAALFRETSPAPVKCALSLCGITLPKVRLPLVEASEETRHLLSDALERLLDEYPDALIEKISTSTRTRRLAAAQLA
jgi:dihydrodipicolinate synthase/N-acetylneuraminate lyase